MVKLGFMLGNLQLIIRSVTVGWKEILCFQLCFLTLQLESMCQMLTLLSNMCGIQTADSPVEYFVALGEIVLQFFQSDVFLLNYHQHSDNSLINQRHYGHPGHSGRKVL